MGKLAEKTEELKKKVKEKLQDTKLGKAVIKGKKKLTELKDKAIKKVLGPVWAIIYAVAGLLILAIIAAVVYFFVFKKKDNVSPTPRLTEVIVEPKKKSKRKRSKKRSKHK